MQIVVIGAGAIGSAVARELVERPDVSAVRVVDTHVRALQELAEHLPSPKLQSYQVDARDRAAVGPILDGASCVIGAGAAYLGVMLARLALEHGAHYCDLGGPDSVLGEELDLADAAAGAGRWIVPGCGLAPGLVNMLCLHGVTRFHDVEAAFIRVGDLPCEPSEPFHFHLGSSPEKLLEDYTQPVRTLQDGTIRVVEPLTGVEPIDFGPPFDRLEAFHTSGSLSHLADRLAGRVRTLDHKSVQWPGHAGRMRFLLGLGFAEDRSIDVRTHLTYRDLLVRRMRQRLAPQGPDMVLMRIVIHGTVDGAARTLRYELHERGDQGSGMAAMRRCTAVPAATVAWMLASGTMSGGGAAPPEVVVPTEGFLASIRDRRLDVTEHWADGHVPVAAPAR